MNGLEKLFLHITSEKEWLKESSLIEAKGYEEGIEKIFRPLMIEPSIIQEIIDFLNQNQTKFKELKQKLESVNTLKKKEIELEIAGFLILSQFIHKIYDFFKVKIQTEDSANLPNFKNIFEQKMSKDFNELTKPKTARKALLGIIPHFSSRKNYQEHLISLKKHGYEKAIDSVAEIFTTRPSIIQNFAYHLLLATKQEKDSIKPTTLIIKKIFKAMESGIQLKMIGFDIEKGISPEAHPFDWKKMNCQSAGVVHGSPVYYIDAGVEIFGKTYLTPKVSKYPEKVRI